MSEQGSTNLLKSLSNKVFVTAALGYRYPAVFWAIKCNLEADGIEVVVVYGTENIWIRDYFPIPCNDYLLKFSYRDPGSYHIGIISFPWRILGKIPSVPIILDGGNVVQGYGKVIITDKFLEDNTLAALARLEELFQAEIILIPSEPDDDLGHADGIVKFVNSNTLLVNDYSSVMKRDKSLVSYQENLYGILSRKGFNLIPMPNAYHEWDWNMTEKQFRQFFPNADDYNPGFGYYINFLKVGKTILLPAMRLKQDQKALEVVKACYPKHRVVMIDCFALSMEGGLLNCVTWSV